MNKDTLIKRVENCRDMLEALMKIYPQHVHRLSQMRLWIMWRIGWRQYNTEEELKDWENTITYVERFLERLAKGENVWV